MTLYTVWKQNHHRTQQSGSVTGCFWIIKWQQCLPLKDCWEPSSSSPLGSALSIHSSPVKASLVGWHRESSRSAGALQDQTTFLSEGDVRHCRRREPGACFPLLFGCITVFPDCIPGFWKLRDLPKFLICSLYGLEAAQTWQLQQGGPL